MRGTDTATLLFVSALVGLSISNELRDIKLCEITFESRNGPSAPVWVQAALFILGSWRQYAFLGMLAHIVAMLVLHRGSDAISICFNVRPCTCLRTQSGQRAEEGAGSSGASCGCRPFMPEHTSIALYRRSDVEGG